MMDMTVPAPNRGHFLDEASALDGIVSRLVSELRPVSIYLFGSRGRGTNRPDSDFDLLVVTDSRDGEQGYDYDRVYAPVLGTGVGCDVVPCREDDFERERENPTSLIHSVLQHGVCLYDRQAA